MRGTPVPSVGEAWEVHRCENVTWVALREGEWVESRPQLAGILHDVPFDTCYVGTRNSCYEQWETDAHGMMLSCDTETARYATTLPFFTRVRALRVHEALQESISLSACAMLTHVCLMNETSSLHELYTYTELLLIARCDESRESLRARTAKTAALLAALPVLQSLQLRIAWDPSVIVSACAHSLVSFKCDSCATLEAPMPRLEVFACYAHFAFLADSHVRASVTEGTTAGTAESALRGSRALKSVFISHAWAHSSLFESMLVLPHLEHAILPTEACLDATEAARARASIITLFRGSVVHLFDSSGELLLMPVLSFLLRMRCLARTKRFTFAGDETLRWVLFNAPTRLFTLIWKRLRNMCLDDDGVRDVLQR